MRKTNMTTNRILSVAIVGDRLLSWLVLRLEEEGSMNQGVEKCTAAISMKR